MYQQPQLPQQLPYDPHHFAAATAADNGPFSGYQQGQDLNPLSPGSYDVHLTGNEYVLGGNNAASQIDNFYQHFPLPLNAGGNQEAQYIEPWQLDLDAPVAHHSPQGVVEYANGARDANNDEEAPVADTPPASPRQSLPSPQPPQSVPRASPAVESIVDQALAPSQEGNRVAKKKAGKKPGDEGFRAVRANSCEACRRSKIKCVAVEGAASCVGCTKKNRSCRVSGTDGRTNRTVQGRLDAATAAVNDYLKDAVLLCSELAEHGDQRPTAQALLQSMSDFRQVRSVISNVTKSPLKEFRFAVGPFRPPIFDGITKLSDTRKHRMPQLRQTALEQGEIVASLLAMLAFDERPQVLVASGLVADVMSNNTTLDAVRQSIRGQCSFPLTHAVYQNMRQGIQKRLDAALA
ncbi:hypothetical protein LZ30DRAFT_653405 [Colletotrichum cereale]|nr:hypothetical protein LZ30DRAFT_653405 [Colletotrichum cereale]